MPFTGNGGGRRNAAHEMVVQLDDAVDDDIEQGRPLSTSSIAASTDNNTRRGCCSEKVKTRIGYLAANVIIILLVWSVPDTLAHIPGKRTDMLVTFWFFVIATNLCYFILQGSDPGYVEKEDAREVDEEDFEDGRGLLSEEAAEDEEEKRKRRRRRGRQRGEAAGGGGGGEAGGGIEMRSMTMRTGGGEKEGGDGGEKGKEGGNISTNGSSSAAATDSCAAVSSLPPLTPQEEEVVEVGLGGHVVEGRREGEKEGEEKEKEKVPPKGYCKRCDMLPPLRAHHCRYCNRCVASFDHHCHCIGTCVGERNHCRFWWFLFCQNAAILSAIFIVDTGYVHVNHGSDWVIDNLLPICMSVILWGLELFAGLLFLSHSFFALSSMTSYECAKGPERIWYLRGTRDFDLPFSKGWIQNLQGFCCLRDGVWWAILGKRWTPIQWERHRGPVVRDSRDVCEYPWQNAYYSCC